jgi:hypothetical protein
MRMYMYGWIFDHAEGKHDAPRAICETPVEIYTCHVCVCVCVVMCMDGFSSFPKARMTAREPVARPL